MDPYSIVVAALAAGARAQSSENSSVAVQDAYRALRAALIARIDDKELGADLFSEIESDPERTDILFLRHLRGRPAVLDRQILDLAEGLVQLVDESASGAGYSIDVRWGRGVQVGDHNIQVNTFSRSDGTVRGE
ncbi:hypothetical protein OIE68_12705 [Nocardia vinacea]|uniref:hypothetical protein n=1 Tax=Nocardia vinacea TaxID=96468 RepID=UPI002E15A10B|nr:hypothetical protein OIE68_12705 [Nocardia vinacea]